MRHRLRTFAGVACCYLMLLTQLTVKADDTPYDEASQEELPITEDDRDHWAFRALTAVQTPRVDSPWVRNSIDQFVISRLTRLKLKPLPDAKPETLLRRVSFDLTGLPPSDRQRTQFIHDQSPSAYETLVDRLLASPQYGEHCAQLWLDLARFAETDGFEHDHVRPNAWRYRDWVIDAFNQDMPYDEFVRRQLAGDLDSKERVDVATGFALCGPDMPDINDQNERRHAVLNELTSTIGSVFLGLQLGCAQCHDHKYDPISQADFYRVRSFFDSSLALKEQATTDAREQPVHYRTLLQGKVRPSHLMVAGDFQRLGPRVRAGFPRIVNSAGVAPQGTEPDRRELANWLVADGRSLTARVIVNRLWQMHFGQGLMRTPSDFGVMGDEPRHPELLDWLALELIRANWSIKRIQLLIVTSSTYRQASGPTTARQSENEIVTSFAQSLTVDPENRFLSRQNRRRLTAEAIRDSLLACSDQLNLSGGGPGVMPPLPEEIRKSIRKDHWKVDEDTSKHRRRSIYLFVRRNLRYPFLEVFDRPDNNASCASRPVSTVAPQSLALLNSRWSTESAAQLATQLSTEHAERREIIDALFQKTLCRSPSVEERALASSFLEHLQQQMERDNPTSTNSSSALEQLCLSMLNLNEFVYVD